MLIKGYRKWINVESFIYYWILNEVSRNVDGYRLSTFLYKDKDSKGGKLTIGLHGTLILRLEMQIIAMVKAIRAFHGSLIRFVPKMDINCRFGGINYLG